VAENTKLCAAFGVVISFFRQLHFQLGTVLTCVTKLHCWCKQCNNTRNTLPCLGFKSRHYHPQGKLGVHC